MKKKLMFLLVLVVLLAGCSSHERVTVPPKVSVGGTNTIALLFFDNLTDEYSLAYEIEQKLSQELRAYYKVIDPIEAEWALVRVGLRRGQNPSPDEVVRLGQLLNVDAVLFGEVAGYFTPITQTPPYISGTRDNDKGQREYKWEINQTTNVLVSFTGRLMSTKGGNIIYRQRVEGESSRDRTDFIEWLPEGKQPNAWLIPRQTGADISSTKASALREAVDQFTADLLPTYVWRKVN